ncbi:hypothetical protein Cpir12675_002973 [Ceratocystis pirilliformis]|uniref:37S ribosomal protein YMR-31, mitochondrial n=1 Tax=Ceratocystis pirilliformis TaxID=259994 RepID=A0ABR3Z6W3_9PEZI
MNSTAIRRAASAAAERTPLIKFLGKRVYPPASQIDHAPVAHPMSPNGVLPARHNSFTTYRSSAQQHGPLHNSPRSGNSVPGSRLGPIAPPIGVFFDRSELPPAYHYTRIDLTEIDAIESGGASLVA